MNGNDLSLAAWKRVAAYLPPPSDARDAVESYAREWGEAVTALAANPEREGLARIEHALWRSLCDLLLEAGLVTATDLKSSVRGLGQTPGQELLVALRQWGNARAAIGDESAVRSK